MVIPIKEIGWTSAVIISFALGAQSGAQFLPPPPVQDRSAGVDGFTSTDRRTLESIYSMTRAVRARLFPLEEEQRILRLKD